MRDFDPAACWAPADPEPLLGPQLHGLLGQAFGIDAEAAAAAGSPAAVELDVPEPALSAAALAALRDALGAEHVVLDGPTRAAHANGMSYLDLVRRGAQPPVPPDAVLLPGDDADVRAVLRICS